MTFDQADKLIKKGDVIGFRAALRDGLDPNLRNQYGWTLLMAAAMKGKTAIGVLLIECGAELDSRQDGRETALSCAAHAGCLSFVKLLLKNGASLDCHPFGDTFEVWLDWTCQYGQCTEKIRELFESERQARAERDRTLDQLK
jgi:uncharacterized protein